MVVAQMVPDQIGLDETRENISEVSEQLSQTFSLLTEAKEKLIDVQDKLPSEAEELAQANTTLEQSISGLEESLVTVADDLRSGEQSLVDVFESLEGGLEGALSALDQPAETVNLLHDELRSAIDGENTSLTEHFAETEGVFSGVKSAFDSFDGELEEGQLLTGNTLQELSGVVADLQNSTQALQQTAEDSFESLGEQISEENRSQIEASFDELSHQVSELQMGEMVAHFDDLDLQILNVFETFSSTTDQMGDEMIDLGADLFQQVGDIVSDEIESGIQELIEDTIETTVNDLMEEVMENLVTMQLGVTVTTALAPYIPVIIAAKAVLGIIKKLISLMRFGF